jgi:hypothetical protein
MLNTPSNQICHCQCGALHGTFMVLSQGLNNCGVTNTSECHSNRTDGTRLPIDTWRVSWMVVSLNVLSNCKACRTCRTCKTTCVRMEIRMCRTLHTDSCKVCMGCLMSCKWNLSNQSLKGFPMDGALVSAVSHSPLQRRLILVILSHLWVHTVDPYTILLWVHYGLLMFWQWRLFAPCSHVLNMFFLQSSTNIWFAACCHTHTHIMRQQWS